MKFFISAATKGLGSYRPAIAAHLKPLHDGVHQLEFPADSEKVSAKLQVLIRDCDAVICLMGPAFGCFCPSTDPNEPRRSYTQIEYEIATQLLHKPTFVFIANSNAQLDPFDQSAEDARDQAAFVDRVRMSREKESGREYFPFDNLDQVRGVVDKCVRTVEARLDSAFESDLKHYPLPLVIAWDTIRNANLAYPEESDEAAGWILGLVALLAVQDAAISVGVTELPFETDPDQRSCTKWHALLKATVPHIAFIKELTAWLNDSVEIVAALEAIIRRLGSSSKSRDERKSLPTQARQLLATLMNSLQWLRQYAIAGVTLKSEGQASLRILRGTIPDYLNVAADSRAPLIAGERLFLLGLRQRMALPLWPALWCLPRENESQPVISVETITLDDVPILRLRAPGPEGPPDQQKRLGDDLQWAALPEAWLNSELLSRHKPEGVVGDRTLKVCKLLSDVAWKTLDEMLLPAIEREILLAGRFQLEPKPLEKIEGARTDLYLAVAATDPNDSAQADCVAYLLPDKLTDDTLAQSDLNGRFQRWTKLKHSAVLQPLSESNTDPSAVPQFLLTPFLYNHQALDRWMRRPISHGGRALTPQEAKALLRVAAEICQDAELSGLRILSLPPRHFLCAVNDPTDVRVTGFDLLCVADGGSESTWEFAKRCGPAEIVAPEVRRGLKHLAPSVDTFALGQLLLQLHPIPQFVYGQATLPSERWADPWACFAFHCTALDPALRFPSVEQFLRFLDQVDRSADQPPETVAVAGASTKFGSCEMNLPPFRIGKYPVTNAEYERFCKGGKHHRVPYREDNDRESGPWCPVTGISLDDAKGYCIWLGQQTGGKWRLPTEAEWTRAAALDEERVYPWGSDNPDSARANYERLYDGPSVVGACAKGVSATGCYDMAGNVWEWCTTFLATDQPLRVLKGGAYDFDAADLSLSARRGVIRAHRSAHVGFRVVREEPH